LGQDMRRRVLARGVREDRVAVIPNWSDTNAIRPGAPSRELRAAWGVGDSFVVMYSGNHSPCHPLTSLLHAARCLRNDAGVVFCFIGGGSEFEKVKAYAQAYRLENIVCLPYQPREAISGSLSAADLHVVAMGDPFVGIVHPCKIYNILALGIPVLYIGPTESHVTDLLGAPDFRSWAHLLQHGDTEGIVHAIRAASNARIAGGIAAATGLSTQFAQHVLARKMIATLHGAQIESNLPPTSIEGEEHVQDTSTGHRSWRVHRAPSDHISEAAEPLGPRS